MKIFPFLNGVVEVATEQEATNLTDVKVQIGNDVLDVSEVVINDSEEIVIKVDA